MTEIKIGFSKSKIKFPIIGRIIEFMQKGRYSHTYIRLWNEYRKKWIVIDATAHGVRVGDMDEFLDKNRPVKEYTFEVSESVAESLLWWGLDHARQEYSTKEILGNFIQIIFRLKKNPFRQGPKYQRCNELVGMALEEILGINIDKNLDDIDLVWLDNFLEENSP